MQERDAALAPYRVLRKSGSLITGQQESRFCQCHDAKQTRQKKPGFPPRWVYGTSNSESDAVEGNESDAEISGLWYQIVLSTFFIIDPDFVTSSSILAEVFSQRIHRSHRRSRLFNLAGECTPEKLFRALIVTVWQYLNVSL